MGRSRSVKARQPKELQLAYSVSIVWAMIVALYVMSSALGVRGDPTWSVVFGVAALLAWAWAITTIRKRNAAGKSLEELQALTPDQFEEWTAARFRDLGYSVKVTGRGGDHGADLIAEKGTETAIIQCKRYRNWSVGEPVLRDLLGAMHDFDVTRAYLVTTGQLTQAATDWAKGKPIEVWDGDRVAALSAGLAKNGVKDGKAATAEMAAKASPQLALAAADAPTSGATTCPRCGSPLVERRNRRTGEAFLGCTTYPQCRFTQPLPAIKPS